MRAELFTARLLLLLSAVACTAVDGPGTAITPPSELLAEAVGSTTIRVSWNAAVSDEVITYELQRRADLMGEFATVETGIPDAGGARIVYFDTDVEPDRFYGYRVRALTTLGSISAMTNVAGAKSAPTAGLLIQTTTSVATAESIDADGYIAVVRGPADTVTVPLALNGRRIVSPLAAGQYSVALRGLAPNCNPGNAADSVKAVTVTDQGTATLAAVSFQVSCRDPEKASIVVALATAGDTIDADGVAITTSGIIREAGTPANERVYFQTRTLSGANGIVRFDNLRPGDYEVAIGDVDAPCTLTSARRVELQPVALAVDTVRFAIQCRKPEVPVDTTGRPFILAHNWSAAAARPGDRVSLLTALDLRADTTQRLSALSANLQFDNTVVRYDSASNAGPFDLVNVNSPAPGFIAISAASLSGATATGNVSLVRSWFTVVGQVGEQVRTSTIASSVEALVNDAQGVPADIAPQVRVSEGLLRVSSSAPTPNQPPTARIAGPSSTPVGLIVSFSGAGSTDADGSIAGYAWSFGDGATGSGVSASHTYTTPGSYSVVLTVTDNGGATDTAQVPITVTASAPTTGSVSGVVSSPQRGPLAGVTVSVTGGGTATTSATGAYSIAGVAAGSQTVSLSAGVPADCTVPTARTVTVSAGVAAAADFTVVCPVSATAGTVTGRVTQAGSGAGIAGVRVLLQPTNGVALAAATTASDGSYTIANVPIGSGAGAGTGSITLTDVPAGCAIPSTRTYSGLTAGGTITEDIELMCQVVTTGTISGTVRRNSGEVLAGVGVTVTPTGGSPLAAATTNANGQYTIPNVPAGGGTIALSQLPMGCTDPGPQSFSGVTSGGTLVQDLTVTCATASIPPYPVTASWGAITNSGPTGREVELTLAIDMGTAPGNPNIDGANADPAVAISFRLEFNGQQLDYLSSGGTSSGLNIAAVSELNAGAAAATVNGSIFSVSGGSETGAFTFVVLKFAIAQGFSGSITPALIITELLASSALTDVTGDAVVQPPPALTVP